MKFPEFDHERDCAKIDLPPVIFTTCNPLYFPKGNEFGDIYEPCIRAAIGDTVAYGRTRELAYKQCCKLIQKNFEDSMVNGVFVKETDL